MDILPTSTSTVTSPPSSASPDLPSGADAADPFLALLANLLVAGPVGIPPANALATSPIEIDPQPVAGVVPPAGDPRQLPEATGNGAQPIPPMAAKPLLSAGFEPLALPADAALLPQASGPLPKGPIPQGRVSRKAAGEAALPTPDPHRTRSPVLDRHVDLAPASSDARNEAGASVVPDSGSPVPPLGPAPAERGPAELAPGAGVISADPTRAAPETAASPSSHRSGGAQPVPLGLIDHQGRPVTARLLATEAGDGQRLRIQLDPADLGRVEVVLRLDHAGTAAAVFTVDRPETLMLLQRDARTVTEVLSSAGFTVDPGSVGFTLRDGNGEGARSQQPPGTPLPRDRQDEQGSVAAASPVWTRHGLLDLHV